LIQLLLPDPAPAPLLFFIDIEGDVTIKATAPPLKDISKFLADREKLAPSLESDPDEPDEPDELGEVDELDAQDELDEQDEPKEPAPLSRKQANRAVKRVAKAKISADGGPALETSLAAQKQKGRETHARHRAEKHQLFAEGGHEAVLAKREEKRLREERLKQGREERAAAREAQLIADIGIEGVRAKRDEKWLRKQTFKKAREGSALA
jgi:hypothetical protein